MSIALRLKMAIVAFFGLVGLAFGQDGLEQAFRQELAEWIEADAAKHAKLATDKKRYFVRPGLVADRDKQEIEILAVATGIKDESPIEFYLVGETGKDYEALAVTLVPPKAIHEALVFLGLKPGRTVNYPEFKFWPKGPRVRLTVSAQQKDETFGKEEPAEVYLFDKRTEATLPENGLIFVGSGWFSPAEGQRRYEADTLGGIATVYNDPWTVLDIFGQWRQDQVYHNLIVNPKRPLATGQRLRFQLRPFFPEGQEAMLDCQLLIDVEGNDLRFTLRQRETQKELCVGGFTDILTYLRTPVKAGLEVWLQLAYNPNVPVASLANIAAMLEQIAIHDLVRLEPPPGGFYHQAFTPDPLWRQPDKRPAQPLELIVQLPGEGSDALAGDFVYVDEDYTDDGVVHRKNVWPFDSMAALEKQLATRESWLTDTVFFYAPSTATVGPIMKLYAALRERFPTAYVFVGAVAPPPPPAKE